MLTNIEDANIFMMCSSLNRSAISEMPPGYHIRNIHKDEIGLWKRMPFDDEQTANQYNDYMTEFFNRVYAPRIDLFFERCLIVCNDVAQPIGTCFLWEVYGGIPTIHWFKISKEYEGRGIGRALLSAVIESAVSYPIYLHTQAGSYRAIKLYADFGFCLLLDPMIGSRNNEIELGLPYLKEHMPNDDYSKLRFCYADKEFLRIVSMHIENDF